MKRVFFIYLMTALLSSCVSSGKLPEPISLPVDVQKYFRPCAPLDGVVSMRAYNANQYLGASDVEWTNEPADFQIQMQDPVARALLTVKLSRSEPHVAVSGPLAGSMPNVQVEDGFLSVDGYFIGVKPEELACYLSGYIPFNQTRSVRALARKDQGYVLMIAEPRRSIEVDIHSAGSDDQKICSKISWSAVLGLVKRDMIICTTRIPAQSGRLTLLDKYSLQWETLE